LAGLAKERNGVLMDYKKPVLVQSVSLSSMVDINRYIMPPLKVEIWGGEEKDNLKLLGWVIPQQPTPMKADSLKKQQVPETI
jgi:hypothetical protein